MSRKHENYGWTRGKYPGPKGQDVDIDEGMARKATTKVCANKKAASVKAKSSPIHVGGSRAST